VPVPYLLSAAQMRAAEASAIGSGAVTGRLLMERAGRACVTAALEHWPELATAPHRACILCGPGNNGGDGFVIARLLAQRGWQVDVFLAGDPARLPPDARACHEAWAALGPVHGAEALAGSDAAAQADLLVDALFGTGLTRPLPESGPLVDWLHGDPAPKARRLAVDVPSGLCADSGRPMPVAFRADLTVTFHTAKPGHLLAEGPEHCGRVAIGDIGLARHAAAPPETERITLTDPPADVLKRPGGAHKYDHGHALVLSGGPARTGAARLAARGALRAGAGLVTLAVPPAAQSEAAAQLTAIMLARCGDAAALEALLEDARLSALCLGPGLGVERARDLVTVALAARHPCLLDADALTAWEAAPEALFELLHDAAVLTPHDGEFARLFPDLADRLRGTPQTGPACSRIDAARAAAARAGAVVLLKGPATLIAAPDGRVAVNDATGARAAPWLATAGAGDVLAGIVTGLMARGLAPFRAACAGAWLHAEAARRFGPGLIAEDLPEALPGVFRALEG